jgi:hypothetical protein
VFITQVTISQTWNPVNYLVNLTNVYLIKDIITYLVGRMGRSRVLASERLARVLGGLAELVSPLLRGYRFGRRRAQIDQVREKRLGRARRRSR